jgi:hypothetical protein
LLLSSDSEGFWRRRGRWRDGGSCAAQPVTTYRDTAPPVSVYRDKRLQTDKRALPEFREPKPDGLATATFVEPDDDTFTVQKHHRGQAKTSYVPITEAPVEVFDDLGSLIVTLPDDDEMRARTQENWDFDRINEMGHNERRNVRVTAYLFAVQKEADNDFHLILDDDGSLEEGAKMNAEISGIPTDSSDRDQIAQVRQDFKDHFNGNPPQTYKPFIGPVRVVIEGSLFFDRDHPSGTVGPQGYRPASAWEIHPIRSIQFLGN